VQTLEHASQQSLGCESVFTARCYGERGIAMASLVCPSVCDARHRDHIGWNSSNLKFRK